MTRWKWVALLAVAFVLSAGPAHAQTKLRYKLKEGEKLEYVMDQKMKMAMSVGGKDININMNQVVDMRWTVGAVDSDGNAKVQVKFTRVKIAMDGPMGNVEIDSADDKRPDDPVGMILGQVVQAISGMEMDFTLTPTGKIQDVKIPEAALKKLQNLPGADQIGSMFTGDNLKNMVQGNLSFPEEAVEKGKSWDQKQDVKMPFGKLSGNMKYTYQGEEKRDRRALEKIAYKTSLKLEPSQDSPFKLTMKAQDGQGKVLFDNAAGRLIENNLEQNMEMTIDVGGMTIEQNIRQETRVRLKEAKSKEPK